MAIYFDQCGHLQDDQIIKNLNISYYVKVFVGRTGISVLTFLRIYCLHVLFSVKMLFFYFRILVENLKSIKLQKNIKYKSFLNTFFVN